MYKKNEITNILGKYGLKSRQADLIAKGWKERLKLKKNLHEIKNLKTFFS